MIEIELFKLQKAYRTKESKTSEPNLNEIAREYGIRSIPSLLFFHNGEVKNQITGVVPKNNIEEILNSIN